MSYSIASNGSLAQTHLYLGAHRSVDLPVQLEVCRISFESTASQRWRSKSSPDSNVNFGVPSLAQTAQLEVLLYTHRVL